ncbi:MAG: glucosaminidase domain-containing protein, partial [Gammaproteobacteria bacterium]|nr:glucosaminidase domain-containing protein [Gammaproteobacteria bacterium]
YTDRGYTDQEELDNLSLVDLNGRVYDPAVGRMISADPTVPDAFYSQAFNRFAYVYDNPLDYTDPTWFVCQANTGTEVCNEMDGGSTGYITGYNTGNGGADQPWGPGDPFAGKHDNDNHADPPPQEIPLGTAHAVGMLPIPTASLLWWLVPCITCSMPGSFFDPLDAAPTQQNQGATGGDNSKQPSQQQPGTKQQCLKQAAAFVSENSGYANQIAQETGISETNLLGLGALESNFGTSNIATNYNNYFGLTVGSAFQGAVGTYTASSTGYSFGVYPSPGFLTSGLSFAQSFQGAKVVGINNPVVFATALTTPPLAFNSEPGYAGKLVVIINEVEACP